MHHDDTALPQSLAARGHGVLRANGQPVIGFVLANRSLMAGVSFDGSHISPLNLQN